MRHLLTHKALGTLLAHLRASLLGFDFDGTLAPITQEPAQAQMRPRTRALLTEVATRFPCVVLSGRGRDDVQSRLTGVALREVFGNHGLEPWHSSPGLLQCVKAWRELLEHRLSAWPGVRIEDKVYSLGVHYRQAEDPRRARLAILAVLAELQGARILGGKKVYNVIPAGAAHKGTALAAAMERFSCATAIYVGDDRTDEDVFATCDPDRVLGVHVGYSRRSCAAYYLRTQLDIDALLEALLQ